MIKLENKSQYVSYGIAVGEFLTRRRKEHGGSQKIALLSEAQVQGEERDIKEKRAIYYTYAYIRPFFL
jgi:hypothetical protein